MIRARKETTRRSAGNRWRTLIALAAVAWVLSAPAHFIVAGEPDAEGPDQRGGTYGRTPDTVIPYRNFREPYWRFFQKVMPFRGTGRDVEAVGLPEAIRIGVLAPTGKAPDAELGKQMIDGITLAVESANAAGGYQGIPFKTVIREDSGLWGSTANEIVTLKYQDDVLAVIGSIDAANTHIALRVALKIELPMVNTGSTDPTLTETNIPWLVRCMADDRQQGYALAHHIFVERGIEKVAAFRVNDRYGRTGIAEFRDAARRLRHPLRVELRWTRGERDFSRQLDRIAQTKVEAVVLWGNASDTAAVVQEMRRRNMPQLIFGCDRVVSDTFLKEAGEVADGVVAVATFNPTKPNSGFGDFSDAFRTRFGTAPGTFAAHAFDGANMLIGAIRAAGLNRARIRDALYEYTSFDGVTGTIEFDTTLNDIGPVFIATVSDGQFVYQRAKFAQAARVHEAIVPYRALSDSPPVARSQPVTSTEHERTTARIGCFLPLDERGQSAVEGIRMALAEDAEAHPREVRIELVVRDSRDPWGHGSQAATALFVEDEVLSVVGSTERRGTHLLETLAAKLHIPVITLCGDDPTIHTVPLPWIFSVAPAGSTIDEDFVTRFEGRHSGEATAEAAMGYDAGRLLVDAIRHGPLTRVGIQRHLMTTRWHQGVSGTFRFDPLGRRVDRAGASHNLSSLEAAMPSPQRDDSIQLGNSPHRPRTASSRPQERRPS